MASRRGAAERPLKPVGLLPRRFILLFVLALALVLLLILALPHGGVPAIPRSAAELQEHMQQKALQAKKLFINPNIPKIYNPFGQQAHRPPDQKDSKLGDDRWFTDLKWLNPFSSSVTLDPDRAVLPPLLHRTPIYTYYDGSTASEKVKEAENDLVLAWRRAWWAKGFRPIVLGRADARKNAVWHQKLLDSNLHLGVEKELERWLAWIHMGGGILSNWLVFPMDDHEDAVLSFLRAGTFDEPIAFKNLGAGLFCGSAEGIERLLEGFFKNDNLKESSNFMELLPSKLYKVESHHDGLAHYDLPTITSRYKDIANELVKDQATAMASLAKLINAHLHATWQSSFPSGVAIVKSVPQKTTHLVGPAVRLGQILRQCPDSPDPRSCPPNRPSCKPCEPAHPMQLTLPSTFENDTKAFTIGTVPHPYTFNSLVHTRKKLDVSFVRRSTTRDPWIISVTSALSKKAMFGPQRLVMLKDAVAGTYGVAHSLWFTAEREDVLEWDWVFGFKLPESLPHDSAIEIQAGLKKSAKPAKGDDEGLDFPDYEQLAEERALLNHAQKYLQSELKVDRTNRGMIEAWNMADEEAWRFVRAFNSRRKLERQQWEKQEKDYAGAERPAPSL